MLGRLLIVTMCGASAMASDDNSLMQQATQSAVSSAEFQARLASAEDVMRTITLSPVRQMTMDVLMRDLKKKTQIDDTSAGIIQQVIDLFGDIKTDFKTEAEDDQIVINAALQAIMDCNSANVIQDGWKRGNMTDRQTLHSGCRGEEVDLINDMDGKCDLLYAHFLNVAGDSNAACHAIPTEDANHDNAHIWGNWFGSAEESLQDLSDLYDSLKPPCTDALALMDAKKITCDGYQRDFESHYCQWRLFRNDRCSTLTTCHANKLQIWTDHKNLMEPAAASRINIARVIDVSVCLLQLILDETTTGGTAALSQQCQDDSTTTDVEATRTTDFGIVVGTPDAEDACEDAPSLYPGNPSTAEWQFNVNSESGYQPFASAGVIIDTGITCTDTHPGH